MFAITSQGFEIGCRKVHLKVAFGDIELRIGSLLLTMLPDGLFVEGSDWSWHRTWDGFVTVHQLPYERTFA